MTPSGPGSLAGFETPGWTGPIQSGMLIVSAGRQSLTMIRNGDVSRAGGVGGWQTVDRPFVKQASWWQATPLRAGQVPVMLDINELPGIPLEDRLDVLEAMGLPNGASDPPVVRIAGDAPRMTGITWRLDDVAVGAALYQPRNHLRLRRIELVLAFTELERVDDVKTVSVRRTRSSSGTPGTRQIRAHAGDTLRSIAVRELGQSSDYTQIQGWNHAVAKVDPDAPLRTGLVLVLK